jgi:hypothetical protein
MRATVPFAVLIAPLVLSALGSPLASQQPASPRASQDASMRLHAAWLREMLDLDVKGAVAEYRAIANDRQSRHVRWIAVARLGELKRIGVDVGPMPPTHDAPKEIKDVLALLTPLPVDELLRQARGAAAPDASAGPEPALSYELRPATPAAADYIGSQLGPSRNERQQQRANAISRSRQSPPREPSRSDRERTDAYDVVVTELDGKEAQATNLRELFFPDWKPPPIKGEPAEVLARVRAHLDTWLEEANISRTRRELLTRLRAEVLARGETDPNAALQFVARLPWYGERLLAEPTPDPNK